MTEIEKWCLLEAFRDYTNYIVRTRKAMDEGDMKAQDAWSRYHDERNEVLAELGMTHREAFDALKTKEAQA